MLLGDMGAEIIKIERENTGDAMRTWPPLSDGFSENFASLNRNKRSIALDLKNEADRQIARDIASSVDVIIENYRPGVMARNGLGYDELSAANPKLVYCSISAFGQHGPRSQEGGFDLTIQAASGLMSVTGEPGAGPIKCGVPVADFAAGLYAAFCISSALRDVALGGKGRHFDVAMLGATLGIAALQTSEYFGTGENPRKLGSAHPRNAPYQAFCAQDGHFAMAAGNNSLWAAVCAVIDRRDLIKESKFIDPVQRARHQEELRIILEDIFAERPAAEWIAAFRAAGVPVSPINTYADVLQDEQVKHMNWVQDMTLPNGVATKTFISPVMMSGRNFQPRSPAPYLDAHRGEILRELAQRRKLPNQ
jgi:crotonobetainyl-CoA:carnitine CoA-transferase CaiB-like acyl-CoA transferase